VTRVPLMLTGGLRTVAGMNAAIESGAVDVLGMGRPLTVEPDLPARLLSGAATEARAVRVDTGIKKFDDMLQVFWYQQQLHRMANGLDPDFSLGRFTALATGMKHTLFAA
jgi:hypothetical protein